MQKIKRIIIASILGLICGFICFSLASSGGKLPWPAAVQIILERTLIGFAIGISSVSFGHWSIHGIAMGIIFSVPLAFSVLMAPDNPNFGKTGIFISTIVMGMIYGFFIELVTSIVFKARMDNK